MLTKSAAMPFKACALLLLASACGGSGEDDDTQSALPQTPDTMAAPPATAVPAKSAKRGIAYGYHSAADLRALSQGISWWYNWSPAPEEEVAGVYRALDVEFVPMAWGGTPNANQLASEIPDGARHLLGFNEPNFVNQANKTPAQAAALWPKLEDAAGRRNLQLGAPALNYCRNCVADEGVTYSDPLVYLNAFFAACENCRVDYIPVHWYSCDIDALKWYIGRFKKFNKPIWLTEFACGNAPREYTTLELQKNYMRAAVDYLENEPAVARYAWFSGRNTSIPFDHLLGADGELTELGKFYVELPAQTQ